VFRIRAEQAYDWHSLPNFHYLKLDLFSMMFVGMGLFKLGVLSAGQSTPFYAIMALAGYLIGIPLNAFTAYTRVANNFGLVVSAYSGITFDLGRLSSALAHTAVIMLLLRARRMLWIINRLAAIGQMALTNYLTHSVVCSTLFSGYGFGLFGRLERYQLYYVVAGLWIFQMIVSPIWLRHFHFGPAEWAWRSLTYWKKQPMRKERTAQPAAPCP